MDKKNIRLKIIAISLFFSFVANAQKSINEKTYNNRIRLNYMSITMPKNPHFDKKEMGLGGLHYQLPFNDFLYVSGGMHYALFGDQGGLFTLDAGIGFNTPVYKNIYLDGNIHLGGGGGYRVLINDGSYLNSNIGLELKKKDYAIGVQYSYFDFVSGSVSDKTVSFYIQIPNKIHSTSYKNANQDLSFEELNTLFKRTVSKSAIVVRFDFFNPIGKSKRDIGTPLENKLYVLGFEYQKYVNKNLFLYVHTDAIYKGLRAGFMDLFVGAGYHPIKTKYIDLTTKFSLGSAGGRITPEGGITMYPSIGLDLKPTKNITLATHIGYLKALDGDLEAKTYGLGLKYDIYSGGTKSFEDNTQIKEFKTQGFRVSLENQSYLKIPKTDDLEDILIADLQLLGVNIAFDFNKYLYGFGEAGFAYKERSGGYAHGLIGIGGKTPNFLNNKVRLYLELAGGVAGGGGIDTKQGLVVRPILGVNYDINDAFSLKTSYGRFISYDRTMNAVNFNIGISYNIAILSTK